MLKTYLHFEFAILSILFLQTSWNLCKYSKFSQNKLEIILYILVLFINRLLYCIFSKSETLYYFFHAFAPLSFILSLWLKEKTKILWIVISWVLSSLVLWYLSNYFAYFMAYCIAISTLMREAIKAANSRSKVLKHSYLPIAIAFDLFFSFIAIVLNVKGLNWADSQLIGYLKYLIMPFSLLTLILIYVNFRRYTTD